MKKNLFILATFFLSAISREARAEVLQGFNSITYTNSSATNGEYTNPNGILKMVLQGDGNVIFKNKTSEVVLGNLGTYGFLTTTEKAAPSYRLMFQFQRGLPNESSGNLVLYYQSSPGTQWQPKWSVGLRESNGSNPNIPAEEFEVNFDTTNNYLYIANIANGSNNVVWRSQITPRDEITLPHSNSPSMPLGYRDLFFKDKGFNYVGSGISRGSNASSFTQIPNDPDFFIGRKKSDVISTFSLTVNKMDWNTGILSRIGGAGGELAVIAPAGISFTTAYDASVFIDNNNALRIVFECHGQAPNFSNAVSSCLGELVKSGSTYKMRNVAILIQGEPSLNCPSPNESLSCTASASVPKIINLNNEYYAFWTVVYQDITNDAWKKVETRMTKLVNLTSSINSVSGGAVIEIPGSNGIDFDAQSVSIVTEADGIKYLYVSLANLPSSCLTPTNGYDPNANFEAGGCYTMKLFRRSVPDIIANSSNITNTLKTLENFNEINLPSEINAKRHEYSKIYFNPIVKIPTLLAKYVLAKFPFQDLVAFEIRPKIKVDLISKLYLIALGRPLNQVEAGIQAWLPSSKFSAVKGVLLSPEYRNKSKTANDFVTDSFRVLVNRIPSQTEITSHINSHLGIYPDSQAVISYLDWFMASQEFQNKNPGF